MIFLEKFYTYFVLLRKILSGGAKEQSSASLARTQAPLEIPSARRDQIGIFALKGQKSPSGSKIANLEHRHRSVRITKIP